MASALGSLVVNLGLNAAEFTAGLTKSEYEARQFAKNFSNQVAIGVAKAEIAMQALGRAAQVALNAIPDLIRQAGNFQDLAEKTGASAEAIASFAVAAKIAGSSSEDIAGAMQKLAKNLLGVDDEGKAAGAALSALGLNIDQFKALSPDQQIITIANALAKFADGAEKTGVQMALLGKSGGNLGPFFKELASGAGQVVILNEQLIKQADDYADKQARTKAELEQYAQVAAIKVIPALNNLTSATKDFIAELLGIQTQGKKLNTDDSITQWANNAVRALGFVVDSSQGVSRVFQILGETIAAGAAQTSAAAQGDFDRAKAIGEDWKRQMDALLSAPLFSAKLDQRIRESDALARQRAIEDRGFKPDLPKLKFDGAIKDDKSKNQISDAERYVQSLEKQLEATLDLNEVQKAEVEIYNLKQKALSGLNPEIEKQIRDYAAQIQFAKDAKKAEDERKKTEEEAARIRERISEQQTKTTERLQQEAAQMAEQNESQREQLILLTSGEEVLRNYQNAKLLKAAAELDDKAAMLENSGGLQAQIDLLREQAKLLRERAAISDATKVAQDIEKEKQQLQDLKNLFSDSFASAFDEFISGSKTAAQAFKQFEQDIVRSISRIASQNLANALFGGNTGGNPDIGSLLSKFLSGLFGGGGFGSFFGSTPGIAGGEMGMPGTLATGTDFWRGGPTWVGERGPEIVNLPRGASVTPNHRIGGQTINMTVNVLPGATQASARQAAASMREQLLKSMRER